jgi:cardiolipin synthase
MFEPVTRTHVVVNDDPLPPAWLRRAPSAHDRDSEIPAKIYRVGPGRRLHSALKEAINAASEVVLVASFLLADLDLAEGLVRAAERGVRVYVLTASEARLAKLASEDNEFDARMIEEHKALLDRLVGRVLLRSAEHFHAKFLVVDPATAPRGFVTTANLNNAVRENVELGVELAAKAVQSLAAWFSWAFWTEAERELVEKGRLAAVKEPPARPNDPTGSASIVTTTKSHQQIRDAALHLIQRAKRRIVVASYGLAVDHPVIEALVARAHAGVELIILTRPRPAVRDAVLRLAEAGARIFAHDKLHAKALHTDGGAMIMTANLEPHGLDRSFEVGVLLSSGSLFGGGDQVAALGAILDEWIVTFPWYFAAGARPREHRGEVWFADKGVRDPRASVVETLDIKLPTLTALDALSVDSTPPPKQFPKPDPLKIAQRTRYSWQVEPAKLPAKAVVEERVELRDEQGADGKTHKVEHRSPYDPPVYRVGKQRYVLVREARDIAPARKLAEEIQAIVVVK